ETWAKLVKGENMGGSLGQTASNKVPSAGGKTLIEEKGEINKKDPFDAKMKESHFKLHTIDLMPGFAYTFDMTSDKVDSFLRLEDSTGKQLAENDDGGDNQNSRIVYRPSREGNYKVYCTTFNGGEVGEYTLTIKQAEIDAKNLPTGTVNFAEAMKSTESA